jgi:membrane-bound metal-dependent hydrolase YbcI (DUF457 family)
MPVTPFHGGIGLLAKGLLRDKVSFLGFFSVQAAIDLESAYHLARDEWPVHRFFHTFVGASLASVAVVLACGFIGRRLRQTPPRLTLSGVIRADLAAAGTAVGAAVTALLGAVGHVLPDAVMHPDMQPFAPFSNTNPFYAAVSLGTLHSSLVIGGVLGALLFVLRAPRRERKR